MTAGTPDRYFALPPLAAAQPRRPPPPPHHAPAPPPAEYRAGAMTERAPRKKLDERLPAASASQRLAGTQI